MSNFRTLGVFILFLLLVFITFTSPIIDSDFGWHIKVGKYIALNNQLPVKDITSFTMPDYEYTYHSWLTEILLYSTNLHFDLWGVSFLYALVSTLGFLLLLKTADSKNMLLKSLYLSIFVTPIQVLFGIGVRIQTFTFFFLALLLYILSKIHTAQEIKTSYLYIVPLIFVLWVNMHGGFIVGLGMIGLWFGTCFSRS